MKISTVYHIVNYGLLITCLVSFCLSNSTFKDFFSFLNKEISSFNFLISSPDELDKVVSYGVHTKQLSKVRPLIQENELRLSKQIYLDLHKLQTSYTKNMSRLKSEHYDN